MILKLNRENKTGDITISRQTVDKSSNLKDEVQSFFYANDICGLLNNFSKKADIPEYTGTFCPCFSL